MNEPSAEKAAQGRDARLAAEGDTRAFERLYRANVDRIYTLVRRMIGGEIAEDLTQEVFLRAWEKLPTFRGEASFSTWLHRLAINWTLSRRKVIRNRDSRFVSPVEETLHGTISPTASAEMIDFERAVEHLPDRARQVFVLHDVEGYSHDEIGGLLGVSAGTSKSQLHRARMILRAFLV